MKKKTLKSLPSKDLPIGKMHQKQLFRESLWPALLILLQERTYSCTELQVCLPKETSQTPCPTFVRRQTALPMGLKSRANKSVHRTRPVSQVWIVLSKRARPRKRKMTISLTTLPRQQQKAMMHTATRYATITRVTQTYT